MIEAARRQLDRLTAVAGVRGALIISAEDGLVVLEAVMAGVDGRAVAALVSSLGRRLAGVTRVAGMPAPRFVEVRATAGALLLAPAGHELLVVAVTEPGVNVGLVRLALLDAAAALG